MTFLSVYLLVILDDVSVSLSSNLPQRSCIPAKFDFGRTGFSIFEAPPLLLFTIIVISDTILLSFLTLTSLILFVINETRYGFSYMPM